MSKENESVQKDAESSEVTQQLTAEEAVAKMRDAFEESKGYRKKLAERGDELEQLRAEVASLKKSKLEEQGNFKDIAAQFEQENKELKAKLQSTVSTYGSKVVRGAIKEKLLESQCSRPDAILKLMSDRLGEIPVDENFNPDIKFVSEVVELGQKEYPEWFKGETPKINDPAPITGAPKGKDISEMSKEELIASLKD